MRKTKLFKTLLVVAGMLVGSSAWAVDVVSYNFNDNTAALPFKIHDTNRMGGSYVLYEEGGSDYYAKYQCARSNGIPFAYYDFSANVSDAETVTLEFDFYINQQSCHALISIADASYHTASSTGFGSGNQAYGSTGAIFNFGCWRVSSTTGNQFAVNSTYDTNLTASGLNKWNHAVITVDNATKKVSYSLTDKSTSAVIKSENDIDFLNSSAIRCSQIDIFIGSNTSSYAAIDNLVITKTVSETKHNYTINAMAGTTKLQELATGEALENAGYSVSVPKVIVKDGKYYVLNDGQEGLNICLASYTMGTADVTKEIAYTLDESVIYFREAEDINSGQKYAVATSSDGYACGYYASPVTITISQPGYYELETNVTGRDSNSSLDLYTADGTEAVASFAKSIGTGVKTLNFFADANMRVGGPYYNDKFNNSKSIDYILVRKIADVIDINHEFVGAFDFSSEANAVRSSNFSLKQGETKVFTFQNHGTTFGNNWRIEVKEGETWKANVCADSYDYTANTATNITSYKESKDGGASQINLVWDDFAADMADSRVIATLTYGTDGKLAIRTTSTGTANGYIYYVDHDVTGLSSDLTINLSVCKSWLEIISVEQTAISATIPTSGYGSLAVAQGLDFSGVAGLTAYVVTKTTTENVTLTSVDELPANSGVILKGTAGSTYSIPVKADAAYAGTNLLSAAVTDTDIAANTAYILQGGLFHLVTEASTVPAGKAYLLATNVPSTARTMNFVFEDETQGISAVETTKAQDGQAYNLAGQRVKNAVKGLYIVNGKKVIIK